MGSGSRPGHGTGLFSWSAKCSQSDRCAAPIGTRRTPSTTSAFGATVFCAFAVLAFVALVGGLFDVLVGVEEDGEHAASTAPPRSPAATAQIRLTSSSAYIATLGPTGRYLSGLSAA